MMAVGVGMVHAELMLVQGRRFSAFLHATLFSGLSSTVAFQHAQCMQPVEAQDRQALSMHAQERNSRICSGLMYRSAVLCSFILVLFAMLPAHCSTSAHAHAVTFRSGWVLWWR
jgi:hypothetical protein